MTGVAIVAKTLRQEKMNFGGPGHCFKADNESVAALSKGTTLPETLGLVADVENWSVLK